MSRKILTTTLSMILTMAFMLTFGVLFTTNVASATKGEEYLRNNDCFVITPAENWVDGSSKPVSAGDWSVNVQNGGSADGKDIHLWEDGTDSKFRACNIDYNNNTFKIQVANKSDDNDGRFWDVKGRDKDSGAIIHVWGGRDSDDASQRFYLQDDNDNDPETFYILNLNSGKYLVPEDYYKDADDDDDENKKWDRKNGINLIQSRYDFSWRVHILNREPPDSADYFKNGDYFVMSPAEKWIDGVSKTVPSAEWEVTAQNEGNTNGDDIQMYEFGISSKFRVLGLDDNHTFKIQVSNYQETKEGKYWDIEDRSLSSGDIVHVWSGRESDDASQRFYLMQDDDKDPETFYIKNLNSEKYLAPRNYFADPGTDNSENKNWDDSECNVIQSNFAFRWRIRVLNREVPEMQKYSSWMSWLPDTTYLSQMSIPGSHDSCTANVEGGEVSGLNCYACQKYFIDEQLIAGIRAFDLRTNENSDSGTFVMIHGYKYAVCHLPGRGGDDSANMTLYSVLNEMIDFLKDHPSETIIATLKIDKGKSDLVNRKLAQLLLNDYLKNSNNKDYFYQWHDENDDQSSLNSPQLSEVRGKIVLLSRVDFSDAVLAVKSPDIDDKEEFTLPTSDCALLRSYSGPDISEWDNNYDDSKHYAQVITDESSGVKVWIQDDWECYDSDKKEQFFNTIDQLNGVLQTNPDYASVAIPDQTDFVFNYTSKTTGEGVGPLSGSRYMNDLIFNDEKFLDKNQRLGIVMMDYVDKPIAARIISHNNILKGESTDNSSSALKESSITLGQSPLTVEQPALLASAHEIVWPTSASVTYGYILEEAMLHFDDPDTLNKLPGFFYFENNMDILTVNDDSGKPQTLIFESYDGTVKESAQITVTVRPRDLPVYIGNHQTEYGEIFDITQTSYPSAGGYFLSSDLEALKTMTAAAGLHYEALDENGNSITITSETRPCTGIIRLNADNPDELNHPNYYPYVKDGVWTILPRTVSVNWSNGANGWEATIDNIINGDEVFAVVNASPDGNGATLTLGGVDADAYRIANGDEIPPIPAENTEISNILIYAVMVILAVLVIGACVVLFNKKTWVNE